MASETEAAPTPQPPPETQPPPDVTPVSSQEATKEVQGDRETLFQAELSEILVHADEVIREAIKADWKFEDLPSEQEEAGNRVKYAMLAAEQAKAGKTTKDRIAAEWDPASGEGKVIITDERGEERAVSFTQTVEDVLDVLNGIASNENLPDEVIALAKEQTSALTEHLENVRDFVEFTKTFEVAPEDKPKLQSLIEEVCRGKKTLAEAREEAEKLKLVEESAKELENARNAQSPKDENVVDLTKRVNSLLAIYGPQFTPEQTYRLLKAETDEEIEAVLRDLKIKKGKKLNIIQLFLILFIASDAVARAAQQMEEK